MAPELREQQIVAKAIEHFTRHGFAGSTRELAREIGGERVEVTSLMGEGVDPHLYKPTRSDIATLMGAGLHPTAGWGEAPLVDSDRYRVVEQTMRGLITRTPD